MLPLLFILGVAGVAYYALSQPGADSGGGSVPVIPTPSAPPMSAVDTTPGNEADMIDPMDSSTWPGSDSDKIWALCHAIAHAEGYGADPSNAPTTHHNPGDLGPGDTGYPGESHGGSVVSQEPDDATGWAQLYRKISHIISGQSSTYPNTMTFTQFAQKYAGAWQNELRNITNYLNVNPSTRLIDWYNA